MTGLFAQWWCPKRKGNYMQKWEGVLKFTSDTLRRRRPVPPPSPPPSKFRLSPRCATKTARRRESSHRNLLLLFSSVLPCWNTQLFFVFIWSRQSSSAPPNRCVYDRAHSSISSALLFRSVLLTYDPLFFKKRKNKHWEYFSFFF